MPPKSSRRGRGKAAASTSKRGSSSTKEELPVADPPIDAMDTSDVTSQSASDQIRQIAASTWSDGVAIHLDKAVINNLYKLLEDNQFSIELLVTLEESGCLERYAWPLFKQHTKDRVSARMVIMLANVKLHAKLDVWPIFESSPGDFPDLVRYALHISSDTSNLDVDLFFQEAAISFVTSMFANVERDMVRSQCVALINIGTWNSLHEGYRETLFETAPQLRKAWDHAEKKFKKMSEAELKKSETCRKWFGRFVQRLLDLSEDPSKIDESTAVIQRMIIMLVDLMSQLPTRRYVGAILQDYQVFPLLELALLNIGDNHQDLREIVTVLAETCRFEVDDITGQALSPAEVTATKYEKLKQLQRTVFLDDTWKVEMEEVYMLNLAKLRRPANLARLLGKLNHVEMARLCSKLNIRTSSVATGAPHSKEVLCHILVNSFIVHDSRIAKINSQPSYPTEINIWDRKMLGSGNWDQREILTIPKLNLQFLTVDDFLFRNYTLMRLEHEYNTRSHIEAIVRRLSPYPSVDPHNKNLTAFNGKDRMAMIIESFKFVEVSKPKVGESVPGLVQAEIQFSVAGCSSEVAAEWDFLRERENLFLVSIEAGQNLVSEKWNNSESGIDDKERTFQDFFGVKHIRGCQVVEVNAETSQSDNETVASSGVKRIMRVNLDCAKYALDTKLSGDSDVYSTLNILIRRDARENNAQSVLATIRGMLTSPSENLVPNWLHNLVLGYGNPSSVHHSAMLDRIEASRGGLSDSEMQSLRTVTFHDTLLDRDHINTSFPSVSLEVEQKDQADTFSIFVEGSEVRRMSYSVTSSSQSHLNRESRSKIRFTPEQVESIASGLLPGLTLIVGPPGTGKSEVAVNIVYNLYRNFATERTLIITHSNDALDILFAKLSHAYINPRHMLRLGHGADEVQVQDNWSLSGRIQAYEQRRQELLFEVQRLEQSMELNAGAVGSSCETAANFFSYHLHNAWQYYIDSFKQESDIASLQKNFPFNAFFTASGEKVFPGDATVKDTIRIAEQCWLRVCQIFDDLKEIRAMELLHSNADRSKYLISHGARIIAMTSTHAAIKRAELIEEGFRYDNLLIEGAAQIKEIESLIPLTMQSDPSRLKRIILIGDHNQLLPVVQNKALRELGNLKQSMFKRFIRLGVPIVTLDAQGRCRPSLRQLFGWRYPYLKDLYVCEGEEFSEANPGFCDEFQFINVDDYMNSGESEPRPHFLQNLGEAEYVVAVYQYMRLIGYPADKITILATYNGQVSLIEDVLESRCGWNANFGRPLKITTVDQYQGQQNDYVLLSLVRTKNVGHLRDICRLTVALSRARLGLYVFGRQSLFSECRELVPAFKQLSVHSNQLELVPDETFTNLGVRKLFQKVNKKSMRSVKDVVEMGKFVYEMLQDAKHTDLLAGTSGILDATE